MRLLLTILLSVVFFNWATSESDVVQSFTAPPTFVRSEPIASWLIPNLLCPHSVSLFSGRKDIKFVLYNKNYPRGIDISEDVGEGKVIPNSPIKFLIHGFLNSGNTAMVQTIKNAYMARTEDFNVIAVDWTKGSGTSSLNYYACLITSRVVPLVAKGLAEFIVDLVEMQKVNILYVNVIGFSLGGQIAGLTGKRLIEMGHKLPIIVALDPAQPSFKYNKESERLAPTDADYVEVIHTNCDDMGFLTPLGTADFYPNWGFDKIGRMPGCLRSSCSHARAVEYFAESIMNPYAFEASKCDSFESMRDGRCQMEEDQNIVKAYMGGIQMESGKSAGVFYLKTNKYAPYGMSSQN